MGTFDEMVEFFDSAWDAKKFVVPCAVGPAGIGKTAAVHQHAHNVNAGKIVTIIASQILPNEVSGITMPVVEKKAMEIFDHYRLSSLQDGDILFFDELLEADQLVLSACLTLIESRELMSGRKLPDIQIIAATNPTIKPMMLKESIRQRFLFRDFGVDKDGTAKYILDKYGIDVSSLTEHIRTTGNEYNILTPRSLTKMAGWICSAKNKAQASKIAEQIDSCWKSGLGGSLFECWKNAFDNPMANVTKELKRILKDAGYDSIMGQSLDDFRIKVSDLESVMALLQTLPEWNEIEAALATIEMEEGGKGCFNG